MAKTLNQIVYSIIEKYTQHKPSDDLELPEEFLIGKINDIRATLIRDEYNNGTIDEKYYQKMCCIDVECEENGCTIRGEFISTGSSTIKITLPPLITDVDWNEISFLGSPEWNKFHRKTLDAWISNEDNPWTGGKPIYTVVGSEAYLRNLITPGMRKVCGIFLLSNPVDACDYDKDVDIYPIPSEYKLELLVLKDLLSVGYKGDMLNDGQEDTIDPRTVSSTAKAANQEQ